jgi:chromosomal replication initiator protein
MQPDFRQHADDNSNIKLSDACSDDDNLIAVVRREIGDRDYSHWFVGKTRLVATNTGITVSVGSPFLLHWMVRQFREPMTRAAVDIVGPAANVEFVVDADLSLGSAAQATTSRPDNSRGVSAPAVSAPTPDNSQTVVERVANVADQIARKRTGRRFADLSEFVDGTCNELAFIAARQVSRSPGEHLNPLFLHGQAGTGKTHLLEGIYREIRRLFPELQVTYLTSEAFTNYFTEALREKKLAGFRQRFRSIDVLLVDDVDFLDSKRAIQEEFLHTIMQLQSHGRQVVVSSDRHPRLLTKLCPELITRFLSGLVCRLESPDFDTRLKIVQTRANQLNSQIAPDALQFVAKRFINNVRELIGALNCLDTWFQLKQQRITLTVARRLLADLERECMRIINMADIEKAVCGFFGVTAKELKSPSRQRTIAQPRMLAMYLARKHTQAGYTEIGKYFSRNHSTVIAAEKRVRTWLEEDAVLQLSTQSWPFRELLNTVESQLLAS